MQVTWDSKAKKVVFHGQHRGGNPRLWSISLRIANDEAKETMLIRPRGKLTMHDLEPLIAEHIDMFETKHGELTTASWIANAR